MPSEASSVVDFTNSGNRSRRRNVDAHAAPEDGELRRRNAVIGQQLLAERLVAREQQAAWVAARVGLAHQLEKGDDVLVVRDDAVELLEQIEDDVRLPVGDRAAQIREAVEHADAAYFVSAACARCEVTSYSVRHRSISFSV